MVFTSALIAAKEVVKTLNLDEEPKFMFPRRPGRRHNMNTDVDKEQEQSDAQNKFRTSYFLPIVDVEIRNMTDRFSELRECANLFEFIFDLSKLKGMSDIDLQSACNKLADAFSNGSSQDVHKDDLFSELKIFRYTIPSYVDSALGALKYLCPIRKAYPNLGIAYRLLLIVPITVASAERSFSRLKLIMPYLRSTMTNNA